MKTINDWIAKYGENHFSVVFTRDVTNGGYVSTITFSKPSDGLVPEVPEGRWDVSATTNNLKSRYEYLCEVDGGKHLYFDDVVKELNVYMPTKFYGVDLVDRASALDINTTLELSDVMYALFPFMYDPSRMEKTSSQHIYSKALSHVYGCRELTDELYENDLQVMGIDVSSVADRITIKLTTFRNLHSLFKKLSFVYKTNLEINTAKFKPIDPGYNHTLLEVIQQDDQFVGLYRSSHGVHKDYVHQYKLILRNGIIESTQTSDGFYPPYMFTMLDDEFRVSRLLFAKEVCKYTESLIADLIRDNKISNQYILDNQNVGVMESVECE